MAVNPQPALANTVVTGGLAIQVFPGNVGGGLLQNPVAILDQGISVAEPLYVDPTGATPGSAPGQGNGTTFVIQPGQSWAAIPRQSTVTKVNAATAGHKFSGVFWYPEPPL
jgi:hypothetical protein